MAKKSTGSFYRRIVNDAFRVAWHHKHLWVFGFFATMAGFGSVSEVFMNAYNQSGELVPRIAQGGTVYTTMPGVAMVHALIVSSSSPFLAAGVFAAVGAIVLAIFAWISLVSLGALLSSARKIERGGEPTFAEAVKTGTDRFWPLLGITAATKLASGAAFAFIAANLFFFVKDHGLGSGMFYLGSFIVFTAIAVSAAVIGVFASVYAVLKNERFVRALSLGARLYADHWLVGLEMALVLLLVNLVVGIIAAVVVLVFSVPIIFLIVLAAIFKAQAVIVALMTVSALMLIIAIVLAISFLTSLQAAAWTLLWAELVEKKPAAKLVRAAHAWLGR